MKVEEAKVEADTNIVEAMPFLSDPNIVEAMPFLSDPNILMLESEPAFTHAFFVCKKKIVFALKIAHPFQVPRDTGKFPPAGLKSSPSKQKESKFSKWEADRVHSWDQCNKTKLPTNIKNFLDFISGVQVQQGCTITHDPCTHGDLLTLVNGSMHSTKSYAVAWTGGANKNT